MMKKKSHVSTIYFVTLAILLILTFLFPYTGDDWAWGSQIGIDRLNNWFDNYSGRYFGNIIVLILTRSRVLRALCMSVCLLGIILIVNKLTGKIKINYWLIILCMLLMPVPVLRQAIVWTSGFANYSTSIFLTLIYILYTDRLYRGKMPIYSKWAVLPLVMLGIGNTLIVEHLTIYNVVLGIWILFFGYLRFKKIYIQHAAYSIGTILGTIYMFMNPVYRSVASGADSYRSIGSETGFIDKAVSAFLKDVVQEGFLNNVILNVCLCIVCILIFSKVKDTVEKKYLTFLQITILIITTYAIWSVMETLTAVSPLKVMRWFDGFFTLVYILAVFVFLLLLPVTRNKKIKVLFIFFSVGMMMAPLLVVTPIGSRCFFASYVMFIYLIAELIGIYCKQYAIEKEHKAVKKAIPYVVCIISVLTFYLIYIYSTIYICDQKRVEKARADAESGMTVIEVENLPYGSYIWTPNPTADTVWKERFELFYGIDEEITIENVDCHLK